MEYITSRLAIGMTTLSLFVRSVAPCMAQLVATPGYVTADKLVGRCTGGREGDEGLCLGYILGVADAMQAAQATNGTLVFGWRACPPHDTTALQVREVVVHFLLAYPDTQGSSASGLIAKALADAFPCPLDGGHRN
jgi:hypothetical protein